MLALSNSLLTQMQKMRISLFAFAVNNFKTHSLFEKREHSEVKWTFWTFREVIDENVFGEAKLTEKHESVELFLFFPS